MQSGPVSVRSESKRRLPGDSSRLPFLLFVPVAGVASGVWLHIGRHQWFVADEWDFLANRDGGSPSSLFTSHNGHWTTLPIISYRVLWSVFGLRTYLPYQLVLVVAHIFVGGFLLLIMWKVGTNPWIALAATGSFLLFGPGIDDVVWAFQITFVGAVLFGLLQLWVADHTGPISYRDGVALVAGVLSLMCSGVGLTMVAAVGVAMLLRRGWRAAVIQTVPLFALYVMWWTRYGHTPSLPTKRSELVPFAAEGLKSAYREMGQLPGLGILLIVMLAVGGLLLCRDLGTREAARQFGVPISLLLGSVVFISSFAVQRAGLLGNAGAGGSRYLYIVAALSIPALAVAADSIARRGWPVFFPLALAVFLVPIPFGIYQTKNRSPYLLGTRSPVVVARTPGLDDLPPDTIIEFEPITIGWLRHALSTGKLPQTKPESHQVIVDRQFSLALRQTTGATGSNCRSLTTQLSIPVPEGDSIHFNGGSIDVFNGNEGGTPFVHTSFDPMNGETLTAVLPHVNLLVHRSNPTDIVSICE